MSQDQNKNVDADSASEQAGKGQPPNVMERRGPLNRSLIREKLNARLDAVDEKNFKDPDGEFINRQSTHEPLSLAEKITLPILDCIIAPAHI